MDPLTRTHLARPSVWRRLEKNKNAGPGSGGHPMVLADPEPIVRKCNRCSREARPGLKLCEVCGQHRRASNRWNRVDGEGVIVGYHARKAAGLCVGCGREKTVCGLVRCPDCMAKQRQRNRTYQASLRKMEALAASEKGGAA